MSCQVGSASIFSSWNTLMTYSFQTIFRGPFVANNDCNLIITPSDETFQIWNNIYSQSSLFYIPTLLKEEELFHLNKVNEESVEWLGSFTSLNAQNNTDAKIRLTTMKCHAEKLSRSLCDRSSYLCCVSSQYYTWLRIASLLSDLIAENFGETCGTKKYMSDDEIRMSFTNRFCHIVDSMNSVRGSEQSSALSTLAWAYSGICDKDSECLTCTNSSLFQTIKLMSHQSYTGLYGSLWCSVW
jgi:hypothetical protein